MYILSILFLTIYTFHWTPYKIQDSYKDSVHNLETGFMRSKAKEWLLGLITVGRVLDSILLIIPLKYLINYSLPCKKTRLLCGGLFYQLQETTVIITSSTNCIFQDCFRWYLPSHLCLPSGGWIQEITHAGQAWATSPVLSFFFLYF